MILKSVERSNVVSHIASWRSTGRVVGDSSRGNLVRDLQVECVVLLHPQPRAAARRQLHGDREIAGQVVRSWHFNATIFTC